MQYLLKKQYMTYFFIDEHYLGVVSGKTVITKYLEIFLQL
jgi:hypothetical protein